MPASDPSAKLMQLCKPKPFRMLDDDYTGLGHVNANLDNPECGRGA